MNESTEENLLGITFDQSLSFKEHVKSPFSSKSIHLINECVNEDLGYLKSWLNANKLSLNVTKTQSLVIGGRKRLNDIEKVGDVKFLFKESLLTMILCGAKFDFRII